MSGAQIIGPLWATLSDEQNLFWGGMLGLTGMSIGVLAMAWKKIEFVMPGQNEKTPLLAGLDDDEDDNRRNAIN